MARVDPKFQLIGPLQNLSFYSIRGSEELYVRRKGGPTREQIKKAPQFETTRKNNKEFGGRSVAARMVMGPLSKLRLVTDYNIAGALNALFKPVQALDTVNPVGMRCIELSKDPSVLKGFVLNRATPFESLITTPVDCTISKEKLEATVVIPELRPAANFRIPDKYPWFKITAVLAVMKDLYYDERNKWYATADGASTSNYTFEETNWLPVYPHTPSFPINISLQDLAHLYDASYSCMLALGVAFGTMRQGAIQQVKYVGAGKIMAVS
jgi:hypothetical protein